MCHDVIVSNTGFQRRLRARKWRQSMSFTVRGAIKLVLYSFWYEVHLEILCSLREPQFLLYLVGVATTDFRMVVRSTEFSEHFAITLS